MKKRINNFLYGLLISILCLPVTTIAQNADSLWKVFNNGTLPDTSRLKAIDNIAWSYIGNNPDTAVALAGQQLELARATGQKKFEARAFRTMGVALTNKGNYPLAIDHLLKAAKINEEMGNKRGMGNCYCSLGIVYYNQANYSKALEYHLKDLKIRQEFGDKEGLANSYNNIGIVYFDQSDYPKALDYCLKGLKITEELNNDNIPNTYSNIGIIYYNLSNYPKALEYYLKDLKSNERIGDKKAIADCYCNIGVVYDAQRDYGAAIEYQLKALKIKEEINDPKGIGTCYMNIGNIYEHKKSNDKAREYYLKSLTAFRQIDDTRSVSYCYLALGGLYNKLSDYGQAIRYTDSALQLCGKIKDINCERLAYPNLATAYSKMGNYKLAYESHVKFKTLTDSIFNAENSKLVGDMKTNFEVEKKESELKAEQEKKDILSEAGKKRQELILYLGSCVLFLVILFSVIMYRRFRISQKQKIIIEQQKHQVEEKNKEITDSITYAKGLQEAILPPQEYITRHLPDNFVLYTPKDIVAGDFYWGEQVNSLFFIAAADSTGHGVPGAMVSVVCSNALNRTVKEFGLTDTGKILDKTRELVLETFSKSGSYVKDGMDISLLSIDKKNKKIQWSGANNPLWYIQENEFKQIKADKQPIGKTDNPAPFTAHDIEYREGTVFYLFTDGFADQFGGSKGKKFKYGQLKELILSNVSLPMERQMEILNTHFENWRGNLEQVDDVTIIGIRL